MGNIFFYNEGVHDSRYLQNWGHFLISLVYARVIQMHMHVNFAVDLGGLPFLEPLAA